MTACRDPRATWKLLGAVAFGAALVAGCGGGASGAGAGGAGGKSSEGAGAAGPGGGGADVPFAACGGKIVGKDGKIDAAEYALQATKWDRATIDCRLGPKFGDLHPGDADDHRPKAAAVPLMTKSGGVVCNGLYQYGTLGSGTDFGSTSGQVAYAPDAASDPGLDRVQTVGWEDGVECHQPQQGTYLGGPHPDPAIPGWGTGLGLMAALGRTEFVETGDGILAFKNGLIGATGTQTSGGGYPTIKLPPHKVPSAVAVTTYNEFALVTVWDTAETKAQIAVIALRANSPTAFSVDLFAAPNEAGFYGMQLLGYVDLPDLATPTAIAAGGNNGSYAGGWTSTGSHAYQGIGSIFADHSYDGLRANDTSWLWTADPANGDKALFASGGGAIVASKWEGKVAFVDLGPLFSFVRKVYVDPIQSGNDQALFDSATGAGAWPFDFTSHPEMKPVVVATVATDAPNAVRIGNRATSNVTGVQSKLKAWSASTGGKLTAFDATRFSGKSTDHGATIAVLGSVKVDPNPTALHLVGQYNFGDALVLVSRGNRSVQWVQNAGDDIAVVRSLRDARVDDPVDIDSNDRRAVLTIGDFSAGKLLDYEITTKDGCMGDDCDLTAFDGELAFPGAIYRIDTANVN